MFPIVVLLILATGCARFAAALTTTTRTRSTHHVSRLLDNALRMRGGSEQRLAAEMERMSAAIQDYVSKYPEHELARLDPPKKVARPAPTGASKYPDYEAAEIRRRSRREAGVVLDASARFSPSTPSTKEARVVAEPQDSSRTTTTTPKVAETSSSSSGKMTKETTETAALEKKEAAVVPEQPKPIVAQKQEQEHEVKPVAPKKETPLAAEKKVEETKTASPSEKASPITASPIKASPAVTASPAPKASPAQTASPAVETIKKEADKEEPTKSSSSSAAAVKEAVVVEEKREAETTKEASSAAKESSSAPPTTAAEVKASPIVEASPIVKESPSSQKVEPAVPVANVSPRPPSESKYPDVEREPEPVNVATKVEPVKAATKVEPVKVATKEEKPSKKATTEEKYPEHEVPAPPKLEQQQAPKEEKKKIDDEPVVVSKNAAAFGRVGDVLRILDDGAANADEVRRILTNDVEFESNFEPTWPPLQPLFARRAGIDEFVDRLDFEQYSVSGGSRAPVTDLVVRGKTAYLTRREAAAFFYGAPVAFDVVYKLTFEDASLSKLRRLELQVVDAANIEGVYGATVVDERGPPPRAPPRQMWWAFSSSTGEAAGVASSE